MSKEPGSVVLISEVVEEHDLGKKPYAAPTITVLISSATANAKDCCGPETTFVGS